MSSKFQKISIPILVQDFFCKRLVAEKNSSYQTIKTYRDTFRLLFKFLETKYKKSPSSITIDDFRPEMILSFLDYLEKVRDNSVRSRNTRLAAIRSLMNYISIREPGYIEVAQQVLAIPMKRYNRKLIGFLTRNEIDAILKTPNQKTWNGFRDYVMLATLYNTGARVSEIINLKIKDICWQQTAVIQITGKGRKERDVPLWKKTADNLKNWFQEIDNHPETPIFPNQFGNPLSRSGVEYRIKSIVKKAQQNCQSLKNKRVSPHTFRHTTAMHLLQSGVDISVIALWLGHESIATTHMYIEADLTMKEKALNSLQDPNIKVKRFKADDQLISFLNRL